MADIFKACMARRAQLEVTIADMEAAGGISRSVIYNVMSPKKGASLRSLERLAKLLFVPVGVLVEGDVAGYVAQPVPPRNWLSTIRQNRERYGFGAQKPVEWGIFAQEVFAAGDDDASGGAQ